MSSKGMRLNYKMTQNIIVKFSAHGAPPQKKSKGYIYMICSTCIYEPFNLHHQFVSTEQNFCFSINIVSYLACLTHINN